LAKVVENFDVPEESFYEPVIEFMLGHGCECAVVEL
jgi:hypothetical protein